MTDYHVHIFSDNCYVAMRCQIPTVLPIDDLDVEDTLRARNIVPHFSRYIYDPASPETLGFVSVNELNETSSRLQNSLRDASVKVPINVHCDDASMVASKMWKSGSVVGIQISGTPAGRKGDEHNNMICCLSPTSKISLRRTFDNIVNSITSVEDGFEAFDYMTGKVVTVKMPVACVLSDLAAKSELTPLKGYRADKYCARDMISKASEEGFEEKRSVEVLRAQILEIRNAGSAAERKRLGVNYGIDDSNLDCSLDGLEGFDLTLDFPSDILHHLLLGWMKKVLEKLKNDHLSEQSLSEVCSIIDQITWCEYRPRTTSSALSAIGSQIGRNIKAVAQVLWFCLYMFLELSVEDMDDMQAILRTVFYLSKLSYLLFNEQGVVWTPRMLEIFNELVRTVGAYLSREMDSVMKGAKSHDLTNHLVEDIVRHGTPSGFDCSPGESKMRVQKLKNHYSNKAAPGRDVARKVMKTELTRHIFDGGVLNADGSELPSRNVVTEGKLCKDIRVLLGKEEDVKEFGSVSLQDWELRRNRKIVKKSYPIHQHIAVGVPNQLMKTCRKVSTEVGPLYRSGGFYVRDEDPARLMMVSQIYKDLTGYSYVVGELLDHVPEKEDNFLREIRVKVFGRSGRFVVIQTLDKLVAVPLLHMCTAEDPVICQVGKFPHSVTEERRQVIQDGITFDCCSRQGNYFVVNALALSVEPGGPFSAVWL